MGVEKVAVERVGVVVAEDLLLARRVDRAEGAARVEGVRVAEARAEWAESRVGRMDSEGGRVARMVVTMAARKEAWVAWVAAMEESVLPVATATMAYRRRGHDWHGAYYPPMQLPGSPSTPAGDPNRCS